MKLLLFIIFLIYSGLGHVIRGAPASTSTTSAPIELPYCRPSTSREHDIDFWSENEDEDELELTLLQEEDASQRPNDIEEEALETARLNILKGPVSREEMRQILKRSLEILDEPRKKTRTREFDVPAIKLMEWMTGANIELETRPLSQDSKKDDEDFCPDEECLISSDAKPWKLSTMKEILARLDKKSSENTIKRRWPRFRR